MTNGEAILKFLAYETRKTGKKREWITEFIQEEVHACNISLADAKRELKKIVDDSEYAESWPYYEDLELDFEGYWDSFVECCS